MGVAEEGKTQLKNGEKQGIVEVNPNPSNGFTSKAIDWLEKVIVNFMYDSSQPQYYLSGNFAPVFDETPPSQDLPVHGHLPIGDLKGLFGLLTVYMQILRAKLKVLDMSYGNGTGFLPRTQLFNFLMTPAVCQKVPSQTNTALIYHHGKLLALSEPYVLHVLEDGDLQTLGLLDYDKRLSHSFTAHPKVDPFTGEMFTFGYSQSPSYVTYRVISKDGFMHDPVPITIPASVMMHDFAIAENYAIFMDLPLYFRPKEMVKERKIVYTFDSTKKAHFGVLPRYAKNESLIKWFELPNCLIFHNANAWEEGDEVVLISCRIENPDLDLISGAPVDMGDHYFINQLYEMRFNMKTGIASQRQRTIGTCCRFP